MATGSIFQFSGVGSGFNSDTILQKMLDVERAPVSRLQSRQAQVTQQQTAWRSINTRVLGLGTAADKLAGEGYEDRQATSSDPEVLTASALPGQDLGSLTVSVESLAQNHQQISQGFAVADARVGTGLVTLKVGSASYPPIGAGDGSLTGLRDAINGAKLGVSASILDAGQSAGNNRYRLMLNSAVSGKAGEVVATFNLSGGTAPAMTDLVAAQDSHVKLGQGAQAVDIYSSTNTVSGSIAGVTLDLKAAKPGTAVTVQMSQKTTNLRENIQGLLDQYNGLTDSFNSNFAYNKDSKESGVLFGATSLIQLQSNLFDRVTGSRQVGGAFNSLSSVGINVNDKGKLEITDTNAFNAALNKPGDLKKLFSDSSYGIAAQVKKLSLQATNVTDGIITLEDKRLTSAYDDLDKSIAKTNDKVSRTEVRLREMFLNMETALSKIKAQGSALSAQLSSLPTTSTTAKSS